MFSSRLPWGAPENAWTAKLAAARARGRVAIDLTESNPTRVGLSLGRDAIVSAWAGDEIATYAPDPAGRDGTRAAIAAFYGEERGVAIDPTDVVLTAGTSEAYGTLFKVLSDPGDAIVAPTPSYPLVDHLAALDGLSIDRYALHYDGAWRVDRGDLERALSSRTRAALSVHPNNPTGSFFRRDDARWFDDLCLRSGIPFVVDEVFLDYALHDDPDRYGSFAGPGPSGSGATPGFVLDGLSKAALLPQMKLGWIVVCGPDRFREDARARLEIASDAYLTVGAPAQVGATSWLRASRDRRGALRDRIATNAASLAVSLAGSPAGALAIEGGWNAIVVLPDVLDSESWAIACLERCGVAAHPGFLFDLPQRAALVVSLIVTRDRMEEGASRIAALAADVGTV